ncbi:hypothetical protein ACOZ4L_02735 [Haloplanus ruber]|uniref:Uncharacterized protein n=1 Tax=Haloplanus ruber TaxID=869892 RepID=A0ABD6D0D4_9EURY|nr:hypothetical protein [Haloplanus ruber]
MATTDESETREVSPRPALDVLHADQQRLLFEGDHRRTPPIEPFVDGFETRREVVTWWQAAAVRTFGHIAEQWEAADLSRDRALLDHLTGDSESAATQRQRILDAIVLPACQDAFNHLKAAAVERLPGENETDGFDYRDVDPQKEEHPAMRPAHAVLDRRQHEALARLWGGFEDRMAAEAWLHDLVPATHGALDREIGRNLMADRTARTHLIDGDSREAAQYRERLAIGVLLPAFAEAAKSLQGGAATQTETQSHWKQG